MKWKLSERGMWYFGLFLGIGVIRFMIDIINNESHLLFNRWWFSSLELALAELFCWTLIGVVAFAWACWYHPLQAKKRWKGDNP